MEAARQHVGVVQAPNLDVEECNHQNSQELWGQVKNLRVNCVACEGVRG